MLSSHHKLKKNWTERQEPENELHTWQTGIWICVCEREGKRVRERGRGWEREHVSRLWVIERGRAKKRGREKKSSDREHRETTKWWRAPVAWQRGMGEGWCTSVLPTCCSGPAGCGGVLWWCWGACTTPTASWRTDAGHKSYPVPLNQAVTAGRDYYYVGAQQASLGMSRNEKQKSFRQNWCYVQPSRVSLPSRQAEAMATWKRYGNQITPWKKQETKQNRTKLLMLDEHIDMDMSSVWKALGSQALG